MIKKISEKEFQQEVANGVAVVDFSAIWCGPCKMIAPVLEEISNEMEGKAKFFNVDVDQNPDLAQEYGIASIPALLLLKDGERQEIQVGFQPKESLMKFIEKYL